MLRFIWMALLGTCATAYAQSGFVKSAGQPIPGATVSVLQGQQTFTTTTDADGHYSFPLLSPGNWDVTVEMFGFEPLKQQVDYAAAKSAVNFDIRLKESPFVRRMQQWNAQRGQSRPGSAAGRDSSPASGIDSQIQSAAAAEPQTAAAPSAASNNDSFLISGSLSPGMAQGAQSDSGPDMRGGGLGSDPSGAASAGGANVNAPGFGGAGGGGVPGGFGGGGRFGGGPGGGGPAGARGGGRPRGQAGGAQFGGSSANLVQVHHSEMIQTKQI